MTQRRARHKRDEAVATGTDNGFVRDFSRESTTDSPSDAARDSAISTNRPASRFNKSRSQKDWHELREPSATGRPNVNTLASLIEQDAPLQSHSGLVLMYGPFQSEMQPTSGLGVASWIRECVHKHGLPSLVRYDYRRRAQVYRRDQFQPWLEPLMTKVSS